MLALVKKKKRPGFSLDERPVPGPGSGEVLVRTRYAAICGSDIKIHKWTPWCGNVVRGLPFVPGHECAGTVEALGDGVRGFEKGDMVAAETHVSCGKCWQCRHGRPHTCVDMDLFGHTIDGCFAEYFVIPAQAARRLPGRLPAREGCLLEPLGIPLRAVQRGGVEGDTVAVIGCGPIGQFAIGAAAALGADRIMATDVNRTRLNLAGSVGATDLLDPAVGPVKNQVLSLTGGCGAGTVVEASGSTTALREAFEYVRIGGKIFIIGHPAREVCLDISPKIVLREVEVAGLFGRKLWETWEAAESLLLSGKLRTDLIVTNTFPLARWEEAFATAESGEGCKVVFDFE